MKPPCRWCETAIPETLSRGLARKYCSQECARLGAQRSRRIINAKWQKANPEAHRATATKWAANNPRKLLATRLRKYDLSPMDYEAMYTSQNGACRICNDLATLVVDHCHATGNVRGLLCNRCNLMMGGFGDNAELLRKAADYLEVSANDTAVHQ